MRRRISFLLVICMVLGSFGGISLAEEFEDNSGKEVVDKEYTNDNREGESEEEPEEGPEEPEEETGENPEEEPEEPEEEIEENAPLIKVRSNKLKYTAKKFEGPETEEGEDRFEVDLPENNTLTLELGEEFNINNSMFGESFLYIFDKGNYVGEDRLDYRLEIEEGKESMLTSSSDEVMGNRRFVLKAEEVGDLEVKLIAKDRDTDKEYEKEFTISIVEENKDLLKISYNKESNNKIQAHIKGIGYEPGRLYVTYGESIYIRLKDIDEGSIIHLSESLNNSDEFDETNIYAIGLDEKEVNLEDLKENLREIKIESNEENQFFNIVIEPSIKGLRKVGYIGDISFSTNKEHKIFIADGVYDFRFSLSNVTSYIRNKKIDSDMTINISEGESRIVELILPEGLIDTRVGIILDGEDMGFSRNYSDDEPRIHHLPIGKNYTLDFYLNEPDSQDFKSLYNIRLENIELEEDRKIEIDSEFAGSIMVERTDDRNELFLRTNIKDKNGNKLVGHKLLAKNIETGEIVELETSGPYYDKDMMLQGNRYRFKEAGDYEIYIGEIDETIVPPVEEKPEEPNSGGSTPSIPTEPDVTSPSKPPVEEKPEDNKDKEETDKPTKIKIENKEKVEKIKYLEGYGKQDKFNPNKPATRLELITWIDRLLDIEAPKNNKLVFKDLNKEMKNLISKFVDAEIINGYKDGTFRPDKGLTRAEAVKVLRIAFNIENKTKKKSEFKDIDKHWAKNDIEILANNGYIKGYPNGKFNPDKAISRAELVTMINNIVKTDASYNPEEKIFSDLNKKHWAFDSIMKVITK